MMKTRYLYFLLGMTLLLFSGCLRKEGFSLKKITSDHKSDPRWETAPISEEDQETLSQIFSYPFTYLGSGNHTYAFVSQDGRYVLKFFKQKHMRLLPWPIRALPFFSKKSSRHQKEREKSFNSYKIAYEHLRDETALYYLHLNQSSCFEKMVTLIDQHGTPLSVPIDQMEFLVQKKAEVGYSHLDTLFSSGEKTAALASISSLISIVYSRIEKGFFDQDLQLFKNFGFIGTEAIEIDIGEFCPDPTIQSQQTLKQELDHIGDQLLLWTKRHHPTYFLDVKNEIEKSITKILQSQKELL
jgi:hypothetical protein